MANATPPSFGERMIEPVTNISDFIWGGTWDGVAVIPFPPLALILLGVGLWIMIGLRFYPIVKLGSAFAGLFRGRKSAGAGEISPFAALSTALSGQVGTGNLAGVATAIALGGPGAIFWMWVTALFGMALGFAEGSLAIRYREKTSDGVYRGGPMSYIMMGLGPKYTWLAILFCLGTLFSALVTGNSIQANEVASGLNELFGFERWLGGLIVAIAVFIVIIGGIKSIGRVAESIVPFMAAAYIVMAIIALILNFGDLPETFGRIFDGAFNVQSASGGFAGAAIILAIRAGVARGLFSNESGQGSTPIAHAVAQTNDPEQQGRMAMLGTFIDTIVICTMTALVILTVQGDFTYQGQAVDHVWQSDLGTTAASGFVTTSGAFAAAFPFEIGSIPLGTLIASVALILFVFTTLLTWSYYGERAITFLYDRVPGSTRGGEKKLHIAWRVIWCIAIFIGATQPSQLVWRLGDISNAAMALPNLLALALLSGVVFKLARGDRTAGPTHTAETPEEPEEY
ncbi:alanine/glycine:cation symporter family protein [Qipengyuania huizhouensis]|uniref:alanine/glycine:cation symporter family protein n=1 Tax=Qipengyuania huizhouensis TaxID=2867245 RepID=UPI00181B4B14|nr:alanine/glycine:cation symporter family protein [Qipengyuania huizhouensis]MBA4764083.1 alanine:cation symporter family protein [Erythrobacter sp.]MBL4809883.1 alanine:cation symporter family protein [Phycisphaerales bacterium]MBX7459642.1 alanine:cation symporter family protein [Qipengyuania huizhouensis]